MCIDTDIDKYMKPTACVPLVPSIHIHIHLVGSIFSISIHIPISLSTYPDV